MDAAEDRDIKVQKRSGFWLKEISRLLPELLWEDDGGDRKLRSRVDARGTYFLQSRVS